ncbi:hypothetical protein HXC38_14410, partial [Listeria monocytogenes]|nr:hypothetical protein [Listeria monocytogenes]
MRKPRNELNRSENVSPFKDTFKLIKDYNKFTSNREHAIEILCSLFFSVISVLGAFFFLDNSNRKILELLISLNSSTLAIMAILAGFNMSSLALIGSANLKFLDKINTISNVGSSENDSLLGKIVKVFAFGVILNLILIVIGILISTISEQLLLSEIILSKEAHYFTSISLRIVIFIWITGIFYSLLIAIKNVSLLYNFI